MSARDQDSAIDDLILAVGLLVRRMRSLAPAEQRELTWTQKSVVARLVTEGPMTAADLARAEGVKPQSMGTAIAHLEELGFVEKKPHESDGRQIIVKLTARGAASRKSGKDASRAWLAQAIAKLDRKQQAVVFDSAEIFKRLTEL